VLAAEQLSGPSTDPGRRKQLLRQRRIDQDKPAPVVYQLREPNDRVAGRLAGEGFEEPLVLGLELAQVPCLAYQG
jgi:hypothetical protein